MLQIPKESYIDQVTLKVQSLENMCDFYEHVIGLSIRQKQETEIRLGTASKDLVVLKSHPTGKSNHQQSGLYHLALLMPDRTILANWLKRFLSLGQELGHQLDGAANHSVSEAVYLRDPEGNGIEICADRPKQQWEWEGEQVKIATAPLHLDRFLNIASHKPMKVLPDTVKMGHVHLQVANIDEARAFYVDTLGFNLMADMTKMGALFVAAGSYHHHIGLNTWHSRNKPADQQALGLDHVKIRVPDSKTIEKLIEKVEQVRYPFRVLEGGLELTDPSQNKLVFTSTATTENRRVCCLR